MQIVKMNTYIAVVFVSKYIMWMWNQYYIRQIVKV